MQPLYCFKLDESTGKIKKYEISEYHFVPNKRGYKGKDTYCFVANFGTIADYKYQVKVEILDKYVAKKLFTFNGEPSYAFKIIKQTVLDKKNKAQQEFGESRALLARLRFPESFVPTEWWK